MRAATRQIQRKGVRAHRKLRLGGEFPSLIRIVTVGMDVAKTTGYPLMHS